MHRCLIVDDQEQNLYLLQALLKGNGYEVEGAGNGAEALEKARRHPPDLIISDILMPVMDGFSLCREWRRDNRLKTIPFIFYTATYTDTRDEALGLSIGADRFLVKPLDPDTLIREIAAVMRDKVGRTKASTEEEAQREPIYLKEYNEVLIHKLEQKMLKLEEVNKALETEIAARKQVEDALRDSEEQYRSLFENSMDGVLLTVPDGHVLKANPAACRIFGRSESEICAVGRADVVDISDPRLSKAIEERTRTGSFFGDLTCIRKDGTKFPCELSSVIFKDSGGKLKTSMIIRDITERKSLEEEAHLAHERVRHFIDSNVVGVIIATADGKVIEANDYYLSLIGFTREEFESGEVDWRFITPPEWLPADEKAIRELHEKGTCVPYEKEYERRDGTRISVFLVDTMLPGLEEQIAAFVLDITERKRAEYALQESEKKLREVQEMACLGSWRWDVKTGDVEWSEEVYKIFHLDPKEFKPNIDSILALSPWPDDHQRDKELINKAIETHGPGSYEQKFILPDKSIGYYYSTFQGNYDTNGDLVSIIGTVMDITARKLAEEEINRLNKDLEQKINERTIELRETIAQLEELNRTFVGRELKMIELKERIAELEKRVKGDL